MYSELCRAILKRGWILDCKLASEIAKESACLEELLDNYKKLKGIE